MKFRELTFKEDGLYYSEIDKANFEDKNSFKGEQIVTSAIK